MSRGGKEFNEIFDLTGLRVLVDSIKDCYGAVGIIHSVWKPIPGRFKDYIAMPKFNMYQSLHTTVIGPGGKPLEIQIRTFDMHQTAEFGVAAHWLYKERGERDTDKLAWLHQMMEWQSETGDPREFMDTLRVDLFEDEVFVFTPKGDVKSLPAGSTPIDFAYAVHTDVGSHSVGAKVNGRIVPLHTALSSGDIVEIITSKSSHGPSRDWLDIVNSPRARQKIRQHFRREQREDSEHSGPRPPAGGAAPRGPAGAEDPALQGLRADLQGDRLRQARRPLRRPRLRPPAGQDGGQQGHAGVGHHEGGHAAAGAAAHAAPARTPTSRRRSRASSASPSRA